MGEHPGSDDARTADPLWLRNLRAQASGTEPLHEESVRVGAGFAVAEIDRLRARVAELETAGDDMAERYSRILGWTPSAWRDARGEQR